MAPSQRFRLEQWAPHLSAKHGIRLEFAPFESPALARLLYERGHVPAKAFWSIYDFVRRAAVLAQARRYDAIVVHREAALIGPAIYERLLGWMGKPIIFDFDDAIWSAAQAHTNGPFGHLHFYGKTSAICRLATAVTVGNDYLASYARKRNANVHVIPSTIELADYPLIPESSEEGKFVVCWSGSTSTLIHFESAREALERLAREIPLVVKVVCSRPPDRPIAGAQMEFIAWSAEREAAEVAACHVGIMPLPDNEVTRGKCGMKALQFMATGRPVVASPVGVNATIIQSGKNGLLAESADEWVSALERLAKSAALRRELGTNARRTVERGYAAEQSAERFATVVKGLAQVQRADRT